MNSPALVLTSAITAIAAAITISNAVPTEPAATAEVDRAAEAVASAAADEIAEPDEPPAPPPVPKPVPAEFTEWIFKASAECGEVTPGHLAAQIYAESGFNVNAVSYANAQGPAQFTPGTWETWGVDADGDGTRDPFSIPDALTAQARYMCHNLEMTHDAIASGRVAGDPIELALAAYNAGFGAVLRFGGMPAGGEYSTQTQPYVEKIRALEHAYSEFLAYLT
ncbi:lytic transglycosylase domain-containing protein [Hoyosella sp. YIM 151337]|uniref:lytic transglycosylase domain-containing protein n=1 Tax=Hoyosella sp. YIM 151337 TaxID=2992742 RepID=UPI002235D627|nr:lytic transglycosylase domain-containing protein [Hoyosella sp. YIM 151337]MCW4353865.1 lytic transglycosylase domain-containing protein [Hoyosella sp. YIM 151337]